MRIDISFWRIFILISLVLSLGFKILDPQYNHPLLNKIALKLDFLNIDVIQDWQSNQETEGNPILAPIANYPLTVLQNEDKWMSDFMNGYANGLLAIKSDVAIENKSLLEKWNETDIENRIFLSFTRDDAHLAKGIKNILISEGYQVFIYFEENNEPICDPNTIAYFMKTAGEVLILDTDNSRNKAGVIAEALSFAKYTYKSNADLESENEMLLNEIEDKKQMIDNYFDNNQSFVKNIIEINLRDSIKFNSDDELQRHYNFDFKGTFDKARKLMEGTSLYKEGLSHFAYNKKLTELSAKLNFEMCLDYRVPKNVCPVCINLKKADCNVLLNPILVKKLIHK